MPGSRSGWPPARYGYRSTTSGPWYSAPTRLRSPEVPEADQRVVVAPLVSSLDTRPLDPPERPLGRIFTRRDARASFLHLVRERVQDADHDHAIGAAVETALDRGRDLMPAVEHSGMRKDHDASGSERRRKIPFPPPIEAFERSALSHLVVLGAIELVNLLLELLAIESHFRTAWTTASSPITIDRLTSSPPTRSST